MAKYPNTFDLGIFCHLSAFYLVEPIKLHAMMNPKKPFG